MKFLQNVSRDGRYVISLLILLNYIKLCIQNPTNLVFCK